MATEKEEEGSGTTVMVFGDSNASASVVPEAWTGTETTVHVERHPGIRARDMALLLQVAMAQDRPDVVILMAGTNDLADDDDWRVHVENLQDMAEQFGALVFVVDPSEGHETSDGVHYNQAALERITSNLMKTAMESLDDCVC